MQRRGRWIWRDRGVPFPFSSLVGGIDPKLDANLFVQFRRSFRIVTPLPASAPLRISADGRYRLYVNGAYAGRGPARCEPLFQYYDEYDIAPLLRAGENVVAVLAHSYGRDMSWYELPRADWARQLGCGGIFVECDALTEVDSDARWRYAIAEAWERETPGGSVGFVEVYDARRAEDGWTRTGFDDAAWAQAVVLAAPGISIGNDVVPFPHMVPRDIPPLPEEQRDAVRVVSVVEITVADAGDMIAIAEAAPEPLSACAVERAEALLAADGAATEVRLAAGRAVSIVIDFGRDVSGYPRLELDGPSGATVDVSYCERLRDDGRAQVQRANVITSQNVHRYILRDGPQMWEKFEQAGFRYLQLTVGASAARPDAPVRIRHASVNFSAYPAGDRGAFACSDAELTRIWEAGAYTLRLCMQDGFEDCPSREQRQWVGDAYVQSMVNYACFGDARLVAKAIRQAAQSQRRDGMTQMATPGDLAATNGLYIADYCLLWIMTAAEYVLHTGDTSVVDDVFPNIVRAVAWFERQVGDDGLLWDVPGWIFIDWAEVDKRGAPASLNALFVQALGAAAALAEQQEAGRLAGRWRTLAARVAEAANRLLWDEARGVYVDALLADGPVSRVSQQSNAAMITSGIAPRERWDRMLDYITDESRLVETSTRFVRPPFTPIDEERQVVLAQPYFSHFVHRALAAAGRQDAIVRNIRARWLPMLAQGGTDTFWEHWHGRESRCHAWSATPSYDLSRELLGVTPLAPGFARFRIEPHAGALTWAEGRYPSVRGDIAIAWRRDGGRFVLEIDVPSGTECEVVLPPGAAGATLDGVAADTAALGRLGAGRHVVDAAVP
jgi:alpha-L-rhamnosidase